MSDPINFGIEELVARFALHPERRDVFVEGERDQGLIRAFLEKQNHAAVCVFPISVVNISAQLLLGRQLPHPSKRNEVVALAMELEKQNISASQVACVADADFEYLLPSGLSCALLLLTDYASMELYAFVEEIIHTALVTVAPKTNATGPQLVKELSGPLQFLFSARATNFTLQFGLSWIDGIDKFFSIRSGHIEFDEEEFLKRYLVDRLPAKLVEQFLAKLTQIQSLLTSDRRCRIRGHDFVRVFTWYVRAVEKSKHLNEDSVRQMLYIALRPEELVRLPMFAALAARLTS
jgi:hypothetical protein